MGQQGVGLYSPARSRRRRSSFWRRLERFRNGLIAANVLTSVITFTLYGITVEDVPGPFDFTLYGLGPLYLVLTPLLCALSIRRRNPQMRDVVSFLLLAAWSGLLVVVLAAHFNNV